jgi:chromosome segregation ATPase
VRRVYNEATADLEKFQNQLRQLELHNDEIKNKIAVTRRATYRAEENIGSLEKDKKQQDLLIDSMNEQLKRLQEELGLYEAQLISQKRETINAKETLAQAASEMQIIAMEKKQLIGQWQSSLVAMARRDDALQTTEEALRKQRETIMAMDGEASAIKARSRGVAVQSEKLTTILNKLQTEVRHLEKDDSDFKDRKDKLAREFSQYKSTLESTEAEMETIAQERKRTAIVLSSLAKDVQNLASQIQAMEDTIRTNVSQQTTLTRAASYTEQGQAKLRAQLHEQELQLGDLSNEISRIKMDVLNTTQHNARLDGTLSELVETLRGKEAMIDKYRVEIRRRNDEIEKKQGEVDKLNRKFDQLTSGLEDENVGPLEATLNNLQKSVTGKVSECSDLQREWVKDQTVLVRMENEKSSEEAEISKLKASETVLRQKLMRLESQIATATGELKELQRGLDKMHNTMVKLNDGIAAHTRDQIRLGDENVLMEKDFIAKLKRMEAEAAALEAKITDTKEEKAAILQKILDTEEEIMVWEKKIQLGKETHAVVAASKDGDEASTMKKEIHRMGLRLEQLKRRQEQLVLEMERAIYKREDIATKFKATGKSGPMETKANVQKAIMDLKKLLAASQSEAAELDSKIKSMVSSQLAAHEQLEEATSDINNARVKEEGLQDQVEAAFLEKQRNRETLLRYKRFIERYLLANDGAYQFTCEDPDNLEREIEKAQETQGRALDVISQLEEGFPYVRPDLERTKAILPS